MLALQLSAMKQHASGVLVRYNPTGNPLEGREGEGERGMDNVTKHSFQCITLTDIKTNVHTKHNILLLLLQ